MDGRDLFDTSGKLRDAHYGTLCPGIGVGVLLLGDGSFPALGDVNDGRTRFLMGKRGPLRSDSHPGGVRNEPHRWDVPGGGVEFGETLFGVVFREVQEEVGVMVRNVRHLFHIEHFPEGQHWISHTHAARPAPGSPQPSVPESEREKCVELRYFTVTEAREMSSDDLTTSMTLNLHYLDDAMMGRVERLSY